MVCNHQIKKPGGDEKSNPCQAFPIANYQIYSLYLFKRQLAYKKSFILSHHHLLLI